MAKFSFHEMKEEQKDFMRDMDIHIPMVRDLDINESYRRAFYEFQPQRV
jgi:hypothetical protein